MDAIELGWLFVAAMLVLGGVGALLGMALQSLVERLRAWDRPGATGPRGDVRPSPRGPARADSYADRRAA